MGGANLFASSDAKSWIRRSDAANMVAAYSKKYAVRFDDAHLELLDLFPFPSASGGHPAAPGLLIKRVVLDVFLFDGEIEQPSDHRQVMLPRKRGRGQSLASLRERTPKPSGYVVSCDVGLGFFAGIKGPANAFSVTIPTLVHNEPCRLAFVVLFAYSRHCFRHDGLSFRSRQNEIWHETVMTVSKCLGARHANWRKSFEIDVLEGWLSG